MTDYVPESVRAACSSGWRAWSSLRRTRPAGGNDVIGIDITQDAQGNVVHVALALGAAAGLAGRLDGGQQAARPGCR